MIKSSSHASQGCNRASSLLGVFRVTHIILKDDLNSLDCSFSSPHMRHGELFATHQTINSY